MNSIFRFLRQYRVGIGVSLLLMLLELGLELTQPLLMAKIIDDGILQNDLTTVVTWGTVLVIMSLIAFSAGVTSSFYAGHVSQSFGYDLREGLYRKVQQFSFTNFAQFETSSLITRLTNDVTQLQNTAFMGLRIMLRAPLFVLGSIILSLTVNWKIALLFLIGVPFLALFLQKSMKRANQLFRSVQQSVDRVNLVLQENLVAMRLVKAFRRANYEQARFDEASDELRGHTSGALKTVEFTLPIILLVMNVSILLILYYGTWKVQMKTASVGEVVAIINYATKMSGALNIVSWLMMIFSRAKASADRVGEVLDVEVDIHDVAETTKLSLTSHQTLTFNDVSFRYEGAERDVLRNVSFTIQAGERVAIMGATGAGKSTLFQLIPRLYDVTNGAVLIDGQNVHDLKLDELRHLIGYVPQEVMLFTGTVSENIRWGKEEATMDDIQLAAERAQLHETIMSFPNAYESLLGQKGVNLSGGQKQRLSIARALVRQPAILLLDDSTSALDVETERKLLRRLTEMQCTTLIVTQKVTTTQQVDRILLLEEGAIVAQGTHDELLKTAPLYQEIVASQRTEGGDFDEEGIDSTVSVRP